MTGINGGLHDGPRSAGAGGHTGGRTRTVRKLINAPDPHELFASIVVNANDVVLVTEAEPLDAGSGGPRVIYVNPAFSRMTGYEPEDILGRTPRVLQSSKTDRAELRRLKAALLAWEAVEVELLNVRKDGTEFWVQISITPVSNAAGWYTHWIAIQREITMRKRRELAIQTMLANTSDLMLILNDHHVVTDVSPNCEVILGGDPSDLRGSDFLDALHACDRPLMMTMLEPSDVPRFGRRASAEVRVKHRDGSWRWLDVNVAELSHFSEDSSQASLVLACADITEHIAAKDALTELHARFRSAFDDAPIGMAITSRSGQFLQVNAPLVELLGYSVEDLLTMTVHDVTHPEDVQHAERQRQLLLRGGHPRRQHEARFLHADGTVVGILHSTSVVQGADRGSGQRPMLLIDHIEDVTERQVLESRLQHQALHDMLTGLPNRALFMDRLHQALNTGLEAQNLPRAGTGNLTTSPAADRDSDGHSHDGVDPVPGLSHGVIDFSPVAVLFCDIDRFKAINDTHGHHVGDLVLTAVARRLQSVVQAKDTVARLGGDELVILCPDTGAEAAEAISSRLLGAVREPVVVNGTTITVTLSIGVALSTYGMTSPDELLRESDDAMYAAKDAGRGRYMVHDPALRTTMRQRARLEAELPDAIRNNELTLHYQPQLTLDGYRVAGLEALVRWEHPRLGLLMPGAFLTLAENANLMRDIGRWVLRTALAEATHLRSSNKDTPVIWVNVSASELDDPAFAAGVERALEDQELPGAALGLEITESVLMSNLKRAILTLTHLRSIGVSVAIDDFGTGYSSLSYIARFPVTAVKIDGSFTTGLDDPERRTESSAIITAVLALAHSLHLNVIAEGIETTAQAQILRGLGCDEGQGYFFGRPEAHPRSST